MAQGLITALGYIGAGYGMLLVGVFLFQAKLVYFPVAEVRATPAHAGLPFEEVWISSGNGEARLHGWYVPAASAHPTVLFLHGNGGNIAHRLDSLRIFHQLGLNTLIFDYRGYGRSSGAPSEHGTYVDAQSAWGYLTGVRGIPADRIVIFGRSLGGAVGVWLAERTSARALIIESGFTSIPDLAAHHYPFLPSRWLARYSYDSVARLPNVRIPTFVVHSRNDEIIPFEHGQRLFAAAVEPKQFLEIRGDHNSGFLHSGEHYVGGLGNFLDTLNTQHDP